MAGKGQQIGSAAGAAIGTAILPGIGTILGGLGGSLLGGALDGSGNPVQNSLTPEEAAADRARQNDIIAQNQSFVNATQGQNGLTNQSSVFNQLQQVASGQGPNPAQAMLAQATGQNVANQAALMAGQRGAGANAGLIARQAGMQGANTQQQTAGQGAVLQAGQSLGALNQMGGIAGQQVGQQIQGLGLLSNSGQTMQNAGLGSAANTNQSNVAFQGPLAQGDQKAIQGGISGLGSALGLGVPGAQLNSGAATPSATSGQDMINAGKGYANGGKVNEPRSAYGRHTAGLPPIMLKAGGPVPGQATVKGDSLKNDTVPAMLSPGEIVIPRSVLNSKNPSAAAAKFVSDTLKKKGKK